MKINKLLILLLTCSFVTLMGCSNSDVSKDQIQEIEDKSGKAKKSIFDKVQWEKIKEKNGITLYMQKNKNEKINFYKAEITLKSNQGEKLFNNLMDFDKYVKIFPRTLMYKKIKEISKNKYLMYCQADFKPLKKRDYYEIFEFSAEKEKNKKEWVVEWAPLGAYPEKFPEIKGFVRATVIYGRWKIIELDDRVKISIEYYNNYKLTVTKFISAPFEKTSTIEALEKIIKYSIR